MKSQKQNSMFNHNMPKYLRLKNLLLHQITGKEPDEPFYSERELADLHKLSVFTVRQALTELVKEKRLVRIQGKGTFVADHSMIKTSAETRIGLVWPEDIEVNGVVFSYEIVNMMAECNRRHLHLSTFLYPKEGLYSSDTLLRRMVEEQRLDGLLIYCVPMGIADLAWLQDKKTPFVLVGNDFANEGVFSVMGDVFEGIRMATDYLIELGHAGIGLLNVSGYNYFSTMAALGYRSALGKHNMPFRADLAINMPYGKTINREQFVRWMAAERSTGIVVAEEVMAMDIMKWLLAMGQSIPGDISIIGYSDRLDPSYYPIPLTTVDTQIRIQNQKALDLLDDMIQKKTVQPHVKIEPKLIKRASTGACCGGLKMKT